MAVIPSETWQAYAQATAFLGNSFMTTMRQSSDIGLSSSFWEQFPTFESEELAQACAAMQTYVETLAHVAQPDALTVVSAEYTHLFIGPPKPAAGPWETFYMGEGTNVGFGQPTHEMRKLLREIGLELQNENNQFEDHIGIELLYLSVLCSRCGNPEVGEQAVEPQAVKAFIEAHPLSWIEKLQAAVAADTPSGYYAHLLKIVQALLASLHATLSCS